MTGSKGIAALCAVSAMLLFGAIAAQTAGAAGTTAYECVQGGESKDYSDAHCKNKVSAGTGSFGHVAIANGSKVEVTVTNVTTGSERASAFLQAVVGGLNTIIEAKKVSAFGSFKNENELFGEMWIEGSAEIVVFEEVLVTNRSCEFKGIPGGFGKLESLAVRGTTKLQGDYVKFEPVTSNKLAEFELLGASCPAALKGVYPVYGSIKGPREGATVIFNHESITSEKTLRVKNSAIGPEAGFEGSITIKNNSGTPIAATT